MKYIFQGSIIIPVKVNYVSLFLDVGAGGGICPQKRLVSFQRFSCFKKMLGLKKKKVCDICSVSPIGINRKGTQGPELLDRKED